MQRYSSMDLTGNKKTILTTGCSSGIGLDSAISLRETGYRVFTTARKKEDIANLQEQGFDCYYLDYSDPISITNTLESVLRETDGRLDALFNNGAYGQPGALEDISRQVLQEQFDANVFGWHQLTIETIAVMRKQGYGKIIYNSSVLGFVSLKNRGAYVASKYAIEGLCDTLRLELYGSNIHIVLIEPGPIESNFRINAAKKFKQNIDIENSYHKKLYDKQLKRFNTTDKDPFTLSSNAVSKKLIIALNAKKPKARYFVTTPTYIFAILKRLLSDKFMDAILKLF